MPTITKPRSSRSRKSPSQHSLFDSRSLADVAHDDELLTARMAEIFNVKPADIRKAQIIRRSSPELAESVIRGELDLDAALARVNSVPALAAANKAIAELAAIGRDDADRGRALQIVSEWLEAHA